MNTGGEWHYWYEHNNNTRNILYQEPGNVKISWYCLLKMSSIAVSCLSNTSRWITRMIVVNPDLIIQFWHRLYVPLTFYVFCTLYSVQISIHNGFSDIVDTYELQVTGASLLEIYRCGMDSKDLEYAIMQTYVKKTKHPMCITAQRRRTTQYTKIFIRSQSVNMWSIPYILLFSTYVVRERGRAYLTHASIRFFLSLSGLYGTFYHLRGYLIYLDIRATGLKKINWHEIFYFRFFSWIGFPLGPDSVVWVLLNFYEQLRRYSGPKVNRWCRWHRWSKLK